VKPRVQIPVPPTNQTKKKKKKKEIHKQKLPGNLKLGSATHCFIYEFKDYLLKPDFLPGSAAIVGTNKAGQTQQ
jgi:hypothetical protein